MTCKELEITQASSEERNTINVFFGRSLTTPQTNGRLISITFSAKALASMFVIYIYTYQSSTLLVASTHLQPISYPHPCHSISVELQFGDPKLETGWDGYRPQQETLRPRHFGLRNDLWTATLLRWGSKGLGGFGEGEVMCDTWKYTYIFNMLCKGP